MRYLPLSQQDRKDMLDAIGVASVDVLYNAVPKDAFIHDLPLPDHQGEIEIERKMSALAAKNHAALQGPFFLGAGCYYHHIPATVDSIIQRAEFLTSYTPYQPEISQGTLSVIFQFQTMIARLTGMEIANASMYDGATATAEAAMMAIRIKKRSSICIVGALHPHYEEVVNTYIRNYSAVSISHDQEVNEHTACVIVQTPDFYGTPQVLEDLRVQCDRVGAMLIVVVTEIVSLGLLPAPSSADIVVGEAQSIGVPMSFGGPHLGFLSCKKAYVRQMPGRLCGETVDADGKRSFVLTLNTREQHIRREKATSNICTNQGLCALAFTIHLALLGEKGFKQLARLNHERACELADALKRVDRVRVCNERFFNEFVIEFVSGSKDAQEIVDELSIQGIIAGFAVEKYKLLVTATEMVTESDIQQFVSSLEVLLMR